MRSFALYLVFALLALANLAGGSAQAYESGLVVTAPIHATQALAVASSPRLIAYAGEARSAPGHAGHHHDYHHDYHPGGHHSDHGPDGCCMLCCGVAVPHILIAAPEIFLQRPVVGAYFASYAAAVAKATGGLPFRPPRTA